MLKIDYEIKLNEQGRPCIDLPEEYEQNPEDKFFAIEIARYLLQGVYSRRSPEFDAHTAEMMDNTIRLLGQVGDEMAALIWNSMKSSGDMQMMFEKKFHVIVKTLEERDNIGPYGIVVGQAIYTRQEGLKVLVIAENRIYELKGGIDNEHWYNDEPANLVN